MNLLILSVVVFVLAAWAYAYRMPKRDLKVPPHWKELDR